MEGSRAHHARRSALALAIACLPAAALIAPAVASAAPGTTVVRNGVITYTANGPGANDLSVSFTGGYYVLSDPGGGTLGPGAGCQAGESHQVKCAWPGVTAISVDLGDGNDSFTSSLVFTPTTVHGGAGDDTLTGGASADTLYGDGGTNKLSGGGGDDTIVARNGAADTVSCGSGDDSVTADAVDAVAADCENVDVGSGASPSGTAPAGTTAPIEPDAPPVGTGAGGAALTDPPTVAITQRSATASAGGVVGVGVGCPADAAGGCSGSITLSLPFAQPVHRDTVTSARRRKIVRQISRGRKFSIAAGHKKTVSVRLSSTGRKMLCRRGKLSVQVVATLAQRGGRPVKSTHTITVRAARRRPPSHC